MEISFENKLKNALNIEKKDPLLLIPSPRGISENTKLCKCINDRVLGQASLSIILLVIPKYLYTLLSVYT